MNANAEFRLKAGRLVDMLRQPENADILDQFTNYNASTEHGWANWDMEVPTEYVKIFKEQGTPIPVTVLNHEQIIRWQKINRECDICGSAASDYVTWLIAQGILGRMDVYGQGG